LAKVIFQYFKKQINHNKILVRIDPTTLEGLDILVANTDEVAQKPRQFDSTIYEGLAFDEFE